ncbi:MAG: UTP--glucose-1-phosphate uridylyltransferase GalU [Nitrospinae bacterium]|nr:UTP--glucose-1-phosphate uridylyltransferase GalU [Nitrospinota bacterium]
MTVGTGHKGGRPKKVKKAVFPVAGLGTRFLPATKSLPKEMLPLVDKPVIQYVVEEAIASGIEKVIFVTGRGKDAIENHFDRSIELETLLEKRNQGSLLEVVQHISNMCEFWYVRQKEPLGLGHAILKARDIIGDDPFAVLLGDDVIHTDGTPGLRQLMDVYEERGKSVIALEEVPAESTSKYGVADPEWRDGPLCKIKGLVEKPTANPPSNMAVIGRYVLTPGVFDFLEKVRPDAKGEIQLTTGLNAFCAKEEMFGLLFTGRRYDTGDKLGFLKATVEYGLRNGEMGREFASFLRSIKY